jgi:hypothetical protein
VIVTIHQPDLFPWFGFFRKVARSDVWIVLDHVTNNPRDAAFWGRRVRILVNGQPHWLSLTLGRPLEPGQVSISIRDMTVAPNPATAPAKLLRTVREAYARAPFFREHEWLVAEHLNDPDDNLSRRNMRFIERVMALLGVTTRIVYSSALGPPTSGKTALLVDLLAAVGANTYLCGLGASGYQDESLFEAAGIRLTYNRFLHPVYKQVGSEDFVEGLSILDALFNVPVAELAPLLTQPGLDA